MWTLNFCARVFFFFFSLQTPLTVPQSIRGGEPIVYHLGTITRWDNISYGWHGNGLLGLGGAACQRHFLLVATFLQHPERGKRSARAFCLFPITYKGGGGGRSGGGEPATSRKQRRDEEMKRGMSAGRQGEKSNYPLCSSCHRSCKGALIFQPRVQVTTGPAASWSDLSLTRGVALRSTRPEMEGYVVLISKCNRGQQNANSLTLRLLRLSSPPGGAVTDPILLSHPRH